MYYDVLHYLEKANYLHIADQTHLFCCHYTFLPRLHNDLNIFRDGWDNHPLGTEHNMSLNQLWELGQIHYTVDDPQNEEVLMCVQTYSHVYIFRDITKVMSIQMFIHWHLNTSISVVVTIKM